MPTTPPRRLTPASLAFAAVLGLPVTPPARPAVAAGSASADSLGADWVVQRIFQPPPGRTRS